MADNTFDAIVIGSGITGGWAAKELCEKGLKTLVLERGRNVEHVKDYPTTSTPPWEFAHRGIDTLKIKEEYPIQSTNYAFSEDTHHFFVNDRENPYTTPKDQPFRWIRGYQVGGRSLIWGRQCYRWSDLDFEANLKDGVEIDWPIRYKDLAPWYDYVEKFIGVSGQPEELPQLPDGAFQPPMEMNCVEQHVKKAIEKNWNNRKLTIARAANLTQPLPGRTACRYRNLCQRGCPYGAYFSSNSSTIPAAMNTGNLTLQPHAIVESVIYDEQQGKATGVRVINAEDNTTTEYYGKLIFLCASTLGTTWLLLHSTSSRFPNGLGNDSGVVGHYLMDHHKEIFSQATIEGFDDKYYNGFRPTGIYVPRFRNVKDKHPDFLRGYGVQGGASREGWGRGVSQKGFGADFKKALTRPGPWKMTFAAYGETLPYYENKAELNPNVVDKWGLPTLTLSARFRENEYAMRKDMAQTGAEMLEAAGGKEIQSIDGADIPGFAVHEMGTARMGNNPKKSVLNRWNQMHTVPNVFITDGSAMVSAACQNPSLTYMALTARAVDYAVGELKKQNIT